MRSHMDPETAKKKKKESKCVYFWWHINCLTITVLGGKHFCEGLRMLRVTGLHLHQTFWHIVYSLSYVILMGLFSFLATWQWLSSALSSVPFFFFKLPSFIFLLLLLPRLLPIFLTCSLTHNWNWETENSGHSEIQKSRVWWSMTVLWDSTRADGIREKMGLKSHGYKIGKED